MTGNKVPVACFFGNGLAHLVERLACCIRSALFGKKTACAARIRSEHIRKRQTEDVVASADLHSVPFSFSTVSAILWMHRIVDSFIWSVQVITEPWDFGGMGYPFFIACLVERCFVLAVRASPCMLVTLFLIKPVHIASMRSEPSHLRSDSHLSSCIQQNHSSFASGGQTAAKQTFPMKPMGNCWSWVRVEPRDSHESVSLIWGWGGQVGETNAA